MTNSEESHHAYNPFHEPLQATQRLIDDNSNIFGAETDLEESPPIIKRHQPSRAWMLLIFPAVFLFIIAFLLVIMVIWLFYRRARFDSSFASVTNDALIVDEATRWCQLLAIISHANCQESNEAPKLLGLAISSLLASSAILSMMYLLTKLICCFFSPRRAELSPPVSHL
jgi:hypothetical protein